MMVVRNRDQFAGFVNGRSAGLRSADEAINQLMDQLAQARAEHEARVEEMKREFAAELDSIRGDFAQLKARYALLAGRHDGSHSSPTVH
jgi:hypothetical protein